MGCTCTTGSRTLQSGQLTVPLGPEYDFFQYTEYIRPIDGRGYSLTQPGWAALLIPFDVAGIAGAATPFYGSMGVALLVFVLWRWAGPGAACIGALLCVTSPWLIVSAGSLMSHTSGMTAAAAALACAAMAKRRESAGVGATPPCGRSTCR